MKIIKSKEGTNYKEIEIEKSFLFWKWREVYRMYKGAIFRFKEPNEYIHLSLSNYMDMLEVFRIISGKHGDF